MQKNIFFTSVIVLVGLQSFAQPIIHESYRFVANDSYSLQTVITPQPGVEGPSGPNQVWDFSNLQDDTVPVYTRTFLEASSTAYYSLFPSAKLATAQGDSGFTYWDTINTTLAWIGNKSPMLEIKLLNPANLFSLPMAYGDTQADTYNGTLTYSGFGTFPINGKTGYVVDGYGTLITPEGTYNNTLRVRFAEHDYYSSGDTCRWAVYSWLSDDSKGELLSIEYDTCMSFGSTETINTSGLPVGIYLIRTVNEQKSIGIGKLDIQK